MENRKLLIGRRPIDITNLTEMMIQNNANNNIKSKRIIRIMISKVTDKTNNVTISA